MRSLAIDIETYSTAPLAKTGVHRYAADPTFEILLFAYAVDDGPVEVVDLASGERLPDDVRAALTDPTVTKWAFNAAFERTCLAARLGVAMPPEQWRCSMVWSSAVGLPMSLDGVGTALHLEQQKMGEGKRLITYFCQPCKPTKVNDGRTRNLPGHEPEKWATFVEYCRRDVEVEQQIRSRLGCFPMPQHEWDLWALDQRINDRGIGVDIDFAEQAIACDQQHRAAGLARSREITGLDNPNSVGQLLGWLHDRGADLPDLTKASVAEALAGDLDSQVREVLILRQELSRSSTKKFQAMTAAGERARGLLQFVGAGRTGRWAGRRIQVQNLPRNEMADLDAARRLVDAGMVDALELLYPSIPDTLSQLIRTAFIPAPGHQFVVADFSAIEARVLAWLARERWVLESFAAGEDLYCTTASRMFGVPVVKHGVNGYLRQKGKVAVLACGYGGSVGALTAMGALRMGLAEDELKPIVDAWREANPHITDWWWALDRATKRTVSTGEPVRLDHGITTSIERGVLFITLPSGRRLAYPGARVEPGRFDSPVVTYAGVDAANRWSRIDSYGPKFAENIVQAVARDLLAHALVQIEGAGHRVVMHVHDEVVVEEPLDGADVDQIVALMTAAPEWAEGLPLAADGFTCSTYRKD